MKSLSIPLLVLAIISSNCFAATPASVKAQVAGGSDETAQEPVPSEGKLDKATIQDLTDTTQEQIKKKELELGRASQTREQVLIEQEAIKKQVDIKQREIEAKARQIETASSDAVTAAARKETEQLTAELEQIKSEHQKLTQDLDVKQQETILAQEAASARSDEIESLRAQLKKLDSEQTKLIPPQRKLAFIILVILGTIGLILLKNFFINRLDIFLTPGGYSVKGVRNLRYRTLARIISWLFSLLFITIAGFFILEKLGIDSNTLLAGAGIIGVAFGFGAQSFVRDVISGIFIVIEGQYGVNDFIRIGGHSGTVEDVNLRVTKLRDLEGSVVFVPNGEVKSVINFAKDYAQALVSFYLDYDEDTDEVMVLIEEVGRDIRKDDRFSELILGNVHILGVNAFTVTGVEIKFRIKTIPNSQWPVAREMRRLLKGKMRKAGMHFYQLGSGREQALQPGVEK